MESVANPLYKPKSNVESASVQSESNGNTEQAPAQNIAMHKGGKVMKMEFKRTHKSESAKEKPRSKREIPLPLVDITTLGNCTKCPCVESIGVDVCPKCGHVHSNKK